MAGNTSMILSIIVNVRINHELIVPEKKCKKKINENH